MLKLILIVAAAIPLFLFLKTVFFGKSKVTKQALSDFKKQIDYLVWALMFVIGCIIVYAIGMLIFSISK